MLHGLLRASFIPPKPQRVLRELTRYRATLVRERGRVVNRVEKLLESTNIKLSSVVTDVMGVSAKAMLTELAAGATKPQALAELAKGRLRTKLKELEAALTGTVEAHHRFILAQQLGHIDFLDEQICGKSAAALCGAMAGGGPVTSAAASVKANSLPEAFRLLQ